MTTLAPSVADHITVGLGVSAYRHIYGWEDNIFKSWAARSRVWGRGHIQRIKESVRKKTGRLP